MKPTIRSTVAARSRRLVVFAAILAAGPILTATAMAEDHAGARSTSGYEWTSSRPDGHAPIGVMGDHVHDAGEVMLSYRYMYMQMKGNRDGTSDVSRDEILLPTGPFMVTPTKMSMEMHMLGAMYAPTDQLTLMAMAPFIRLEMDHVTAGGGRFTTRSLGPGDVRLTGLYNVLRSGGHRVHLNAGLSLPTGSIDQRDDTPMADDAPLPYPMQLGSGTVDLLPGVTYVGQTPNWSWGAQALGTVRIGENDNDYTLGDRAAVTVWGARRWTDWLSSSLRLDGQWWDDIDGADPKLAALETVVPTARPDLRDGQRLDVLGGVNLWVPRGMAVGHRLALEAGVPVYQDLDGPQLETDWVVTVGWQFAPVH